MWCYTHATVETNKWYQSILQKRETKQSAFEQFVCPVLSHRSPLLSRFQCTFQASLTYLLLDTMNLACILHIRGVSLLQTIYMVRYHTWSLWSKSESRDTLTFLWPGWYLNFCTLFTNNIMCEEKKIKLWNKW
jgi:hypothetical protein